LGGVVRREGETGRSGVAVREEGQRCEESPGRKEHVGGEDAESRKRRRTKRRRTFWSSGVEAAEKS